MWGDVVILPGSACHGWKELQHVSRPKRRVECGLLVVDKNGVNPFVWHAQRVGRVAYRRPISQVHFNDIPGKASGPIPAQDRIEPDTDLHALSHSTVAGRKPL